MQVQSIKQANSVLKRSLADGVDAMRPAEVQSVISELHMILMVDRYIRMNNVGQKLNVGEIFQFCSLIRPIYVIGTMFSIS